MYPNKLDDQWQTANQISVFPLKHLEKTPNAVCSVLNLHELVHGIFKDLFISFEHKYKGNSI